MVSFIATIFVSLIVIVGFHFVWTFLSKQESIKSIPTEHKNQDKFKDIIEEIQKETKEKPQNMAELFFNDRENEEIIQKELIDFLGKQNNKTI